MSMPVPLRLPHRALRFIRLPLVLATLAMILFYTVVLITWVPNHGYVYQWGSDGGLRIVHVLPDHAAAAHLQAEDRVVAIDGRAVVRSPWRWLFAPGRDAYTYTIARGEEHHQVTLPTGPLPLTLLSLLPRALVGEPYLAWEVGIGLLLLMPLGYGYVIYRRNYLGLDLIATRTLTLLVLGLLFLVLHMGVSLILATPVALQRLTLLAGRMDALACQAAGTAQTAPLAAKVQGQRESLLLVLRRAALAVIGSEHWPGRTGCCGGRRLRL
jgi:hypothetical protein